jgi:hypothetical protein
MVGKACLIFIGVLGHQGNERNPQMCAGKAAGIQEVR